MTAIPLRVNCLLLCTAASDEASALKVPKHAGKLLLAVCAMLLYMKHVQQHVQFVQWEAVQLAAFQHSRHALQAVPQCR